MKCETQQRQILEPNHNNFFSDQTGWFLAGGSALMKLLLNDECRMTIDEWWNRFAQSN